MTTTQRRADNAVQPRGATVELRGLRRRFGATAALDEFSLTLAPGELVALLGPSGCGKTTALRVLAGFETLDEGRVLLDGHDQARIPPQKRDMGMVFQSYSLFPNMTAQDNVAFGLRMRKVRGAQRKQRALAGPRDGGSRIRSTEVPPSDVRRPAATCRPGPRPGH